MFCKTQAPFPMEGEGRWHRCLICSAFHEPTRQANCAICGTCPKFSCLLFTLSLSSTKTIILACLNWSRSLQIFLFQETKPELFFLLWTPIVSLALATLLLDFKTPQCRVLILIIPIFIEHLLHSSTVLDAGDALSKQGFLALIERILSARKVRKLNKQL